VQKTAPLPYSRRRARVVSGWQPLRAAHRNFTLGSHRSHLSNRLVKDTACGLWRAVRISESWKGRLNDGLESSILNRSWIDHSPLLPYGCGRLLCGCGSQLLPRSSHRVRGHRNLGGAYPLSRLRAPTRRPGLGLIVRPPLRAPL
jgi:hypothetical protein